MAVKREATKYGANAVRPDMAPDTMVSAVPAKASWNIKNTISYPLSIPRPKNILVPMIPWELWPNIVRASLTWKMPWNGLKRQTEQL